MSCNSSGYMDGVPVKISEQYKPPHRIILPQNIFQRINLIQNDLTTANYDISFEQNVIKKIKEWRTTKDKESLERRERIYQAQEAEKQYIIEKQAVENEEQRKQLTEVSYPSTDDLSELSSEGHIAIPDLPSECPVTSSDRGNLANNFNYSTNQISNHSSILQPQLMNNITVTSHIPLQNSIGCSKYKINYSDFENDTSSPFDNMELKTINDIELLAQVLSNSQIRQEEVVTDTNTNTYQQSKIYANHSPKNLNSDFSETNSRANSQHITNESFCTSNNYIGNSKITNKMPNGYYNSNFSYNYPITTAYTNYNTYNQPVEYNYPVLYDNMQSSYLSSNKVFNHQINQYCPNIPDTSQTPLPTNCPTSSSPSSHQRSKSRSVPDIVQELEDELSLAKEIVSKRSQNASPAPITKVSPEFSRGTKQGRVKSISESKSVPNETLENPYKNLSPKMQKIAFHISQMGFPLARTARACVAVGDDDKKVVEHLLAMDQLMDLGFSESKVSEALLKFNNDRDKALDFLIT